MAPNFFDLELVEVARGPQGTLHGRNSIAGSISYYTRKPTDEWDALVSIMTNLTKSAGHRSCASRQIAWI